MTHSKGSSDRTIRCGAGAHVSFGGSDVSACEDLRLGMKIQCCDQLLVHRAQSGERRAFDLRLSQYRARLVKLSMRYTRNRADAEDAVQETFMKVHRGLKRFRGEAAFYSWLHRIAINSAKTVLSLRSRDARVFAPVSVNANDNRETDSALWDTPEELALTEEMGAALDAAIEALCDEQRTAIVLREFQGLSYVEVASSMSCPVGTVRSRVFRAREAIDKQLRPIVDGGLGRAGHQRLSQAQSARWRNRTTRRTQPLEFLPV